MVIIPGQTSTVQDFTLHKFGLTSRRDAGASLTLGTQDFHDERRRKRDAYPLRRMSD
jgi:hypothetical protein